MTMIATTPFGRRPVSAGLVDQIRQARMRPQLDRVEKWAVMDDLRDARDALGVTDRDLSVLHALLSFHPEKMLEDRAALVVFPSNKTLAARVHGMAESTLRRHLAALVGAGLIRRHDSPNGKRYAAKGQGGQILRAYGFDLRPLLERGQDIAQAADHARAEAATLKALRQEVVILRRDAAKLVSYVQEMHPDTCWDGEEDALRLIQRGLRRKPDLAALDHARAQLIEIVDKLQNIACETPLVPSEPDVSDAQIERHPTESHKDTSVSEQRENVTPSSLTLEMVVKACPDMLPYSDGPPKDWHQLVKAASLVRPMMGISAHGWENAIRVMGPEITAVCVMVILQKMATIQSPGGYLCALTRKAQAGAFSPVPMVIALLKAGAEQGGRQWAH